MSKRFDELAARHNNILLRCAVQRRHLAQTAEEIDAQLARVDRGVMFARNLARNPALITGGVAVLAMIGPRRIINWAGRALVLYTTAKRVVRLIR